MAQTKPRRLSERRADALLDSIKDEIDTLHNIKHDKQRVELARELIYYIELHHLQS